MKLRYEARFEVDAGEYFELTDGIMHREDGPQEVNTFSTWWVLGDHVILKQRAK